MKPLEIYFSSNHSKKQTNNQKHTSAGLWKGGLYTGFTVTVKVGSKDSISEFILYGSKVNNV